MQLFSCHAFNSNIPPPQEYVRLAQEIIKYSGGLPLALVTVGSHLQGRSIEEWRYEFQKLRAIPHSDIQKILKISFDGLDGDTQSVFLDIACAFHGFSADEVTKTLNACGLHSESAIATLVHKCLLQSARPFLEMHDLVRDMGRELVRMESPQEPGKRSRLFIPQEVREVLQGNKGSEKVEVLMVDPRALKGVNLSTKAFKKMKNLRVLKIDNLYISGKLELLSKDLRWLSWKRCPLKYIPSNFPAEKLVVLNLRGSNIQEFGLNMQCCSLKEMNLSDCKRLRRTPNFNGLQSLETLWLGGCSSLMEIHQSIGNLDRLIYLNLSGCRKLTDLPSSICQLKSLSSLDITSCSSIRTLPVGFGDMRSLKVLLALYTGIKKLARSVEMLRDPVVLEVRDRNLEARRSFSRRRVHHIQSLSTFVSCLSLRCCGLSETDIPTDIGGLYCLEVLDLSGNHFDRLPFGFSKLRFLRFLGLNDCENLQTIPSVSNLEYLNTLSLANCKKLVKITALDNLPSIERIDMLSCSSLKNPFSEGFFSAPALAYQSRKDRNRGFKIDLQCNEIPDWCNTQVTTSSICFTMPTHKEYKFLGIILWCVFKIVNVRSSSRSQGLNFSIAGKTSSSFHWPYYEVIRTGQVQRSCVFWRSYLDTPFNGQINGGEKMELVELGEENAVKKIGIHLLYLDQQGKVTSLPAVLDHFIQMNRSQEIINGV
ncbi:disease resistance protein RUN1-like [Lycium barbarum]|uniref:disease resistance protein RUN1-like n=1 Tax=Lycium barbarum TaxID=112863 RepID=UPI00293F4D78|nr:disease resistance protein RUN1-like [Lycium barbarum]